MTWERQEPGWYTESNLGGICQESDGKWYIYPLFTPYISERKGPFKTLTKARAWADKNLLKVIKQNG